MSRKGLGTEKKRDREIRKQERRREKEQRKQDRIFIRQAEGEQNAEQS